MGYNAQPRLESLMSGPINYANSALHGISLKSLPRATPEQFALPPRDRIIPPDQKPGSPAVLSLEDAERLREKRAAKAAAHGRKPGPRRAPNRPARSKAPAGSNDPWANARKFKPD